MIRVDTNPACPRALADMQRAGELWRFSRLRPCTYLNNIVEADQILGDLLTRARRFGVPAPLLAVAFTHFRVHQNRVSPA